MLRSIIIEDEPLAASLLERYTRDYAGINNIDVFQNAIEASIFLTHNEVDVIFLDLHLPKVKGFEFLESLEKRYHIILTTAYSEYALEGFEKGVIDYLLKPILYSRFELALDRLKELISANQKEEKFISIQVNKTKIKLKEYDVAFIESNRGYVNVYDVNEQMYRTKMTTRTIYDMLSDSFVQIHKSYIINKAYVTTLSSSELVLNNNITLPIGRKFKEEVFAILSSNF